MLFDVKHYGAVGDGTRVETRALQAAIDACAEAGGGTVRLAEGSFVTGTLYLKSGVRLLVEENAALLGSHNHADYTTDTHHIMYLGESHMDRCLLLARDAQNITLEGHGVIDGRGDREHFPGDPRPMLLRLINCEGVTLRDLTLRDPAAWTSAWLYCRDVLVENVTISSRVNWNGDGLDFDGCERVEVRHCVFDTSDDAICLQASKREYPCQDIEVRDCSFHSKWAGMRIGLLSYGDIRRLTVNDCEFHDIEDSGLKIQAYEGGVIEDLHFNDLVMVNVPRPVFLTLSKGRAGVDTPEEATAYGELQKLSFKRVTVDNSGLDKDSALMMTGTPGHPIRQVSFQNLRYLGPGGGTEEDAQTQLAEFIEDDPGPVRWPEYFKLGGTVPAYGLWARHVEGLSLKEANFSAVGPEERPALAFEDVLELDLQQIEVGEELR